MSANEPKGKRLSATTQNPRQDAGREERETEDERETLSPRETEVLKLLAAGYIHKEVADRLDLTVPTVRTYVRRICFKLHVRSKVEAIIKYLS